MMWRVNKRISLNKGGFTLVELLVVMSIMAALLGISLVGYVIFRKELYVKMLANYFQTEIRDTFVKSISVKDDNVLGGSCYDTATGRTRIPKVRALKIPSSNTQNLTEYYRVSYCEVSPGVLESSTETVNIANAMGSSEKIEAWVAAPNFKTEGFMVLVYSSPFGEFNGYWYSGTPQKDDATDDAFDTAIKDTAIWAKKDDSSFQPVDPPNVNCLIALKIKDASGGFLNYVTINRSGNASVNKQD